MKNKNRPSCTDKNIDIRRLARWMIRQNIMCKNQTYIFKKESLRNIWNAFLEENADIFKSEEEIWIKNLEEIDEYITYNNKIPSCESKDIIIKKMGIWVLAQKSNYKNDEVFSYIVIYFIFFNLINFIKFLVLDFCKVEYFLSKYIFI